MSTQSVDIFEYLNTMNAPAHEALRVLAVNIGSNRKQEKLSVLSIASYQQGEGKTTVAVNLAIVVAKSGKRVLYVDTDLRKPLQLKPYGDYTTMGLTDLSETMRGENVICQTSLDNLKFVTVGTRLVDPDEFLGSELFDEFLEMAAQQFDLVILDSPALGNYVDGSVLASKASGVLIITRSQKTSYTDLERIKTQMQKVGANIVGIVVNEVNFVKPRARQSHGFLINTTNFLKRRLTLRRNQSF